MKVLGIIPARGGSKGIQRKNVKLLHGKPLLAYTTKSALGSKRLSRVILSTDDAEIAEIGLGLGVEVPFIRPSELASDSAPTFQVVMHAVEYMENSGFKFDAICLLQPTNPLRRAEDIDMCVELLEASGGDSVISILPVPHQYNPQWVYWRDKKGELVLSTGESSPISRRQDLPAAFHREGSVYITRRDVLDTYGDLYGQKVQGYEIEPQRSVNIDTLEDWKQVEKILASSVL